MKVDRTRQMLAILMLPDLLRHANDVLGIIVEKFADQLGGRHGFFLTITDGKGNPLVTVPVGEPADDKVTRYACFSVEKPFRAGRNGHVASSESRDPANDQWGGGILFPGTDQGLGGSGFPEDWDLAFNLAVGERMKFIDRNTALRMSARYSVECDYFIQFAAVADCMA